jgi:hypothetical protein
MIVEGLRDGGAGLIGDGLRQIDARDLGAQRRMQLPDFHDLSPLGVLI